jgi:Fic family protein
MENLFWYVGLEDSHDPLVKSFVAHYQFETIHPFEDGNGRVGRLLLALMIYKLLGHKMPWLYLSAFFDRYQDEYFTNLFQVSATGQWNQWIEFCLRATLSQANDAIARCNSFRALKAKYHDQLPSTVPRCHMIVDLLFRNPIVRTVSIKNHLNIHYQTAQSDIDTLIKAGILREMNSQRPKTFYAPEIMTIAYDSDGTF